MMTLPDRSFLALVLLASSLTTLTSAQTYGALGNPTGRPIGGGEDYGLWVSGGTRVSTRAGLLNALARATWGSVVYVDDGAEIDLTGLRDIVIPAGVTLASGRGRNGSLGGLLRYDTLIYADVFSVQGTAVRITGLRLRGPDTRIEPGDCGDHDPSGIAVRSPVPDTRLVVVDNNEMWGWPNAAVDVSNVFGVYVMHNHIHDNRRQVSRAGCRAYGLGYGVVIGGTGYALVEANLFDHNRHDIACDGRPGTGYEARYNLVLTGNVQHSFDVHGGADRNDGTDIAGTFFLVHHNTFLQSDKPAFRIRGVPQVLARVWNNEFRHTSQAAAANQTNASGNFQAIDNRVGVNYLPGWFVSFSGSSFWRLRRFDNRAMSAVHLADFDGDGTDDAFTVSNNQWLLSRGARSDWQAINSSSVPFSELRFGDFDGDGRTDVFRTNGGLWQVSFAGTGSWTTINSSIIALSSLGFADFNGDGRTDVFYGTGSRWYVSWGGTSAWTPHNTATHTAGEFAFGDFDGDHRDDVFWTDGAVWRVSWAGVSLWQEINRATVPLSSLAFADLNGDGRTDVFFADGATWRVSWSGTSTWQVLQTSSLPTPSLRLGDVNGDRKADVLSLQNP